MRHLEDPARLIHWVGMHEGDNRPGSAHPLVVQRSVDVLGHNATPPGEPLQSLFSGRSRMIARLTCFANKVSRRAAKPLCRLRFGKRENLLP
jgi:hypothetical protein